MVFCNYKCKQAKCLHDVSGSSLLLQLKRALDISRKIVFLFHLGPDSAHDRTTLGFSNVDRDSWWSKGERFQFA